MTPTERVCAGRGYFLPTRAHEARMEGLPNSLAIAFWVTAAAWGLALLAYIFSAPRELILPLVALGALSGFAEWYTRQR